MSQSICHAVIPRPTTPICPDLKVYRTYREDQDDPESLFQKAFRLDYISAASKQSKPPAIGDLSNVLTLAIYGSNKIIEYAGLNEPDTSYLCNLVFDGKIPSTNTLPLEKLLINEPTLKSKPERDIRIAAAEVIQHAKAYLQILNAFVINGQDFTEELIKSTHKILTTDIPIRHLSELPDTPPSEYGGIYRKVVVGAGRTNFSVPKFIPKHMAGMIENFKTDL